MAKVISFINYKGGVGKTTTTYHVGCSLVQHYNKRVLLIDIDPQTNLTFLCAPYEKWEEFKKKERTISSMYQLFLDRKPLDTRRFIWKSPIQYERGSEHYRISNLDLIPCDIDLLGEDLGGGQLTGTFPRLEVLKHHAKEYLRERMFLKNALAHVGNEYDYVLIDCPPNLYLMTQNALVASHWYVITTIPDHLSTIGLSILQKKVEKIGELIRSAQSFAGESNRSLAIAELGGIIFVKVRIGGNLITNTHADRMDKIRNDKLLGKNSCFSNNTTELIGYSEAAENYLPIWLHDSPNAKRAARKGEYEEITKEFLRRF